MGRIGGDGLLAGDRLRVTLGRIACSNLRDHDRSEEISSRDSIAGHGTLITTKAARVFLAGVSILLLSAVALVPLEL